LVTRRCGSLIAIASTKLVVENGAVVGVRGSVLEPTSAARGVASSRNTVGEFEFRASAVIVASGASAEITIWSGRTGPSGWVGCPNSC